MIREKTKIGLKGQIVIPQIFRKTLGLSPGSYVTVELKEEGVMVEKSHEKSEDVFERISKKSKIKAKIRSHEGYELSMKARWG